MQRVLHGHMCIILLDARTILLNSTCTNDDYHHHHQSIHVNLEECIELIVHTSEYKPFFADMAGLNFCATFIALLHPNVRRENKT